MIVSMFRRVWKAKKTRGAFEVDVVPVLVQYLETRKACAITLRFLPNKPWRPLARDVVMCKPRYHKAVQVATMAAAYLQWKAQSHAF